MHAEPASDIGYKVQAVLVEEDEEEDEHEASTAETQTQPGALTTGTVATEAKEQEPEGEKIEDQEEEEEEEAKEEQSEEKEEEEGQCEEQEEGEKKEEHLEKEKEDGKEVFKQDAEAALAKEFQGEERMKEDKEKNSQAVSQVAAEPAASAVTGGPSAVVCCYTRWIFFYPPQFDCRHNLQRHFWRLSIWTNNSQNYSRLRWQVHSATDGFFVFRRANN